MKRAIALLLAFVMAFALCGCGKTELAKHADDTIAAIGTVTANSLSQIEMAEAEIANLSEKEIKSLDNLTKLYDARAEYNAIIAKTVETAIENIGEVGFDSADVIAVARQIYEAQTPEIKALVTNYDVLEKAEQDLPTIRSNIVSDEIKALLAISPESIEDLPKLDSAIKNVEAKYKQLDSKEKAAVKDYDKVAEKKTESDSLLAQSALKNVWFKGSQRYSHYEVYINFTNPNEKTIKYINWGIMFQNPVGDYMEYHNSNVYWCSDTGPYETGKGRNGDHWYWQFYSSKVDIYEVQAIRLGAVEIEYMDGSVIKIDNPEALESVMRK